MGAESLKLDYEQCRMDVRISSLGRAICWILEDVAYEGAGEGAREAAGALAGMRAGGRGEKGGSAEGSMPAGAIYRRSAHQEKTFAGLFPLGLRWNYTEIVIAASAKGLDSSRTSYNLEDIGPAPASRIETSQAG